MIMNEKICATTQDVQTFEKMHLKLKGPIEEYVFYLTGSTQNSKDLAQEIFLKLWIHWARLKEINNDELKRYVFIMIRNHVIDERRENNRPKKNRRFFNDYLKTHPGYYLHDEVLVGEGLKLHQRAVDQLAKKQRIVYQFHQNNYSSQEIAKMLNRSNQTVENQLSLAYKKVKVYLNKNYDLNIPELGRKNCCKQVALN